MSVKLIDHSGEVNKKVGEALLIGLEDCSIRVETYAKNLAPVDTGRLRNSITHAVDGDTAYIGTNVEYAVYQELGTSRMRAHPFLKPAVQDHIAEIRSILAEALSKIN